MALICVGDSVGASTEPTPLELYEACLINMATFVSMLREEDMSWDEIDTYIKSLQLDTEWEVRPLC